MLTDDEEVEKAGRIDHGGDSRIEVLGHRRNTEM
jgi:hypothetical protein